MTSKLPPDRHAATDNTGSASASGSGSSRGPRLLAASVLALAGAVLATLLLVEHARSGDDGVSGLCGANSGCATVLASRWAWLPPLSPDDADTTGHVPLAALGLLHFLILAVWLAVVGVPGAAHRRLFALLLLVSALGCVASLLLIGLMLGVLDTLCPLCLAAHASNLAIFPLLLGLRARAGGEAGAETDTAAGGRLAAIHAQHPDTRLLGSAVALVVALFVAVIASIGWHAARAESTRLAADLTTLSQDAGVLELHWLSDDGSATDAEARERFDAMLRADDPRLEASPGAKSVLVVFGDAECPSCAAFEDFLHDVVLPTFGGHLEVVFKHFPLPGLHPNAITAARALEAARLQDAAFPMRDALHERRTRLARLDWGELATSLGLDEARFLRDMASEHVGSRIVEDIEAGRQLGVDATPALFLDRRPVDGLLRAAPGFWELRADSLRRTRELRGEGW